MTKPKAPPADTSGITPDEPRDPRAAALAALASSSDVAYTDDPLSDAERAAAAEAGLTVAVDADPAAVRKATADAGTGTPNESITPAGDDRDADAYDPNNDPGPEQTPAELAPADRDTALEALLGGVVTADTREVTLTGNVVDLGGDLERVVIVSRYNAMMPAQRNAYGTVPPYAMGAVAGDVVLVTEKEAERGEKLGGLAELPDGTVAGDTGDVLEVNEDTGVLTDDALDALNARDLIDYVNRHPDEAERVVDAERERAKPRSTILALTDTGR